MFWFGTIFFPAYFSLSQIELLPVSMKDKCLRNVETVLFPKAHCVSIFLAVKYYVILQTTR